MGEFTVQNAKKYVKRVKKADAKTAHVYFIQSFSYQSHWSNLYDLNLLSGTRDDYVVK